MANEIILWDSPNGVNIPANVADINALTSYINILSPKEIKKIQVAFNSELFDMATEYTWNRTISFLREKVLSFGKEFVLEMLGRQEESLTDSTDFISEIDVINLSADLGLINKTAKILFLQNSELLRHFASREVDEELDIMLAQSTIRNCIKYVLAMSDDGYQISFTNFRDLLKREILTDSNEVYRSLLTSPYFYKKTTVRTLLNLSKTQRGAEVEIVFANMSTIIPNIWEDLLSDDRYPVGFAYAEATNSGNSPLVRALKSVLLKVKGFDYVPESLRSNTFIDAANNLLSVHFGVNNFYNEPTAAKLLQNLGSSIPVPALGKCITATLACKIGNNYGVSWSAQEYLDKILDNLTPDRWEYYFNQVFKVDETIILKLTNKSIIEQWNQIVEKYSLYEMNIKDHQVSRLLQASSNNQTSTVRDLAKQLFDNIR